MEVLLVEEILANSPAEHWNSNIDMSRGRSTSNFDALANLEAQIDSSNDFSNSNFNNNYNNNFNKLHVGLAICAVNEIHGDVGPMQRELLRSKEVTLWCRVTAEDPEEFDSNTNINANVADSTNIANNSNNSNTSSVQQLGILPAVTVGVPANTDDNNTDDNIRENNNNTKNTTPAYNYAPHVILPLKKQIAVVAMEDEDMVLMFRWVICSMAFGWVTLIAIILVNPHEERPRQQLFHKHLQKIALYFVLPIWFVLWLLDAVQIAFHVAFYKPWVYFLTTHMLVAAVVVFVGMKVIIRFFWIYLIYYYY